LFTKQRFEYYTSGRTLLLNNANAASLQMLGYAIEFQLKQALIFKVQPLAGRERKLVEHSHDLQELWTMCRDRGLFGSVTVSWDFIEFANDHFERRYPSQIQKKKQQMASNDRISVISAGTLAPYDDFLIQMDDWFWSTSNCIQFSMGLGAAQRANSFLGWWFFHNNAPAVKRADKYLATLQSCTSLDMKTVELLTKPAELFIHPNACLRFGESCDQLFAMEPARTFQYPRLIGLSADCR
jgi:hypothetical protein